MELDLDLGWDEEEEEEKSRKEVTRKKDLGVDDNSPCAYERGLNAGTVSARALRDVCSPVHKSLIKSVIHLRIKSSCLVNI